MFVFYNNNLSKHRGKNTCLIHNISANNGIINECHMLRNAMFEIHCQFSCWEGYENFFRIKYSRHKAQCHFPRVPIVLYHQLFLHIHSPKNSIVPADSSAWPSIWTTIAKTRLKSRASLATQQPWQGPAESSSAAHRRSLSQTRTWCEESPNKAATEL